MDDAERRRRFESLYAAHAPAVARHARRRADRDTAADVVSEVFTVLWRRSDEVAGDDLPWLLGCARRVLDREALLLTAWEGPTTDQAAAVLGCSPEAFRVRAHRARRRLAAAMRRIDQAGDAAAMTEVCE